MEIGTRVRCVHHDGEHRGVVASKLNDGWFGVAWDPQESLMRRDRASWKSSRERLSRDDGLIMTPADAIAVEVAK